MKVKIKKLLRFMKVNKMTAADLAKDMGVNIAEIEKMLNGMTVGINTTRKFIRYFTADEAQDLIDWDAIGKKNPLACDADAEQPDEDDEDDDYGEDYGDDDYEDGEDFDKQDDEDFDEDEFLEREYKRLNYDPFHYVEELVDLEDKYR